MCFPYFHFKQVDNGQCIPTAQLNEYRESQFCLNGHCVERTCRFLLWLNVPTPRLYLCLDLIENELHWVHSPWHFFQFSYINLSPQQYKGSGCGLQLYNPVDFIHYRIKLILAHICLSENTVYTCNICFHFFSECLGFSQIKYLQYTLYFQTHV